MQDDFAHKILPWARPGRQGAGFSGLSAARADERGNPSLPCAAEGRQRHHHHHHRQARPGGLHGHHHARQSAPGKRDAHVVAWRPTTRKRRPPPSCRRSPNSRARAALQRSITPRGTITSAGWRPVSGVWRSRGHSRCESRSRRRPCACDATSASCCGPSRRMRCCTVFIARRRQGPHRRHHRRLATTAQYATCSPTSSPRPSRSR